MQLSLQQANSETAAIGVPVDGVAALCRGARRRARVACSAVADAGGAAVVTRSPALLKGLKSGFKRSEVRGLEATSGALAAERGPHAVAGVVVQ